MLLFDRNIVKFFDAVRPLCLNPDNYRDPRFTQK